MADIKPNRSFRDLFAAFVFMLPVAGLYAENLKVAVASNFSTTLKELQLDFKVKTGLKVSMIQASTGKLFAQITHAAPYDVFLSADSNRAEKLTKNGLAFESVVYAQGQLLLIINKARGVSCTVSIQSAMNKNNFNKLAIANPKIAPYGAAAEEFIKASGNWDDLSNKLVRGENVLQALHFVTSGNAGAALIAKSLLLDFSDSQQYCQWDVPQHFYQPVLQKMVILKATKKLAVAKQFSDYIKSERAKRIIKNNGYIVE